MIMKVIKKAKKKVIKFIYIKELIKLINKFKKILINFKNIKNILIQISSKIIKL